MFQKEFGAEREKFRSDNDKKACEINQLKAVIQAQKEKFNKISKENEKLKKICKASNVWKQKNM